MTEDTLFDHLEATPIHAPDTRLPGTARAFSEWVAAVAKDLSLSAPQDRNIPEGDRGCIPDPGEDPLSFLLSKKALGSHYPEEGMLPGFYAFSYDPPDQGIRLVRVLYSRTHDPRGDLRIDHRAGYTAQPGVCVLDRFFAGFEEEGNNIAGPAYVAKNVDIRHLVCDTRRDLEILHQNLLKSRIH